MTLYVCSIMYDELYTAVMDRKVPIYGPYLQVLFEKTWDDTFENNHLQVGPLTSHEVVQMCLKDKWAGGHGPATTSPAMSDEQIVDETATGGGSVPCTRSGTSFGGGARSAARDPEQSGWASKITRKVRKLFCLHKDIHHMMYQAHKREKENLKLQKQFYR